MIETETLLVAVLSGLGGGLLGTWLQIRHERHEAFRERMMVAADDFVTNVLQANLGLRDAQLVVFPRSGDDKHQDAGDRVAEANRLLERANDRIDQAHGRFPRVYLLFGGGSEPEAAALATILNMREALGGLHAGDLKKYKDAQLAGFETQIQFSDAAAKALRRSPGLSRMVLAMEMVRYWTRRALRRPKPEGEEAEKISSESDR